MASTTSALERHPEFEVVIGIEVHVQLKTRSKMFCSCPNEFGSTPNHNICPICCGHPGTLPLVNRRAVEYGIMAGLATNCHITRHTTFARKHYMYPDLPKNFQITQDDKPICHSGHVTIITEDGREKNIRLIRIHMEEDAGKNIHGEGDESFVDLNRAGTPLLEIVTEPDISSAYEARAYLTQLRTIVQYLGISEANMEEGSFRADTNISVKRKTDTQLGTKVELKNINSFRFITQAIEYEIERQINAVLDGERIIQETRLWDTKRHVSVSMRSKEDAQDYRYFTEPDIPPLVITEHMIEHAARQIPELPYARFIRFQNEYGLTAYESNALVSEKPFADFFEKVVKLSQSPKQSVNWMLRDLRAYLSEHSLELDTCSLTPDMFAEFVTVLDKGMINSRVAQDVFIEMMQTGTYPSIIIQQRGLQQVEDPEELTRIIRTIIEQNHQQVLAYRSGKEQLFGFFVGCAMKATQGKGNPKLINEILKRLLSN